MPTSDQQAAVAWQRWQPQNLLDDFTEPSPKVSVEPDTDTSSEVLCQAELARLRQQAEQQGRLEGQKRGLEEGKQQGYDVGFSEGQQAGFAAGQRESLAQQQASGERLNQIIMAFSATLDNLHNVMPSRLVQHALAATRALLGQNVRCDDTVLLATIKQLLKQDALLDGNIQLLVSPEDTDRVKQHFGDALSAQGWELREDQQMSPGGCRITSATGEFDATLESRWQELCQLSREDLA